MKKKLLISLLCVLIISYSAKSNNSNSYSNVIEAIKKKDNVTFAYTIKEITNVDSLIAVDSTHSYSLLGFACLYNNKEAVEHLIKMKADLYKVYADDIYIYDALYVAINTQNENMVLYLINKGLNVILEIDVQGALIAKEKKKDAVLVFFRTKDMETLEKRLRNRNTDTEEVIQTRLKNALKELEYEKKYDYTIINNDIEESCRELINIINL